MFAKYTGFFFVNSVLLFLVGIFMIVGMIMAITDIIYILTMDFVPNMSKFERKHIIEKIYKEYSIYSQKNRAIEAMFIHRIRLLRIHPNAINKHTKLQSAVAILFN